MFPDDVCEKKVTVKYGVELGNNNLYYDESINEVEQGIDNTDLPSLLMEEAYIDYQGDNWN